jgi:hypothetical protein
MCPFYLGILLAPSHIPDTTATPTVQYGGRERRVLVVPAGNTIGACSPYCLHSIKPRSLERGGFSVYRLHGSLLVFYSNNLTLIGLSENRKNQKQHSSSTPASSSDRHPPVTPLLLDRHVYKLPERHLDTNCTGGFCKPWVLLGLHRSATDDTGPLASYCETGAWHFRQRAGTTLLAGLPGPGAGAGTGTGTGTRPGPWILDWNWTEMELDLDLDLGYWILDTGLRLELPASLKQNGEYR